MFKSVFARTMRTAKTPSKMCLRGTCVQLKNLQHRVREVEARSRRGRGEVEARSRRGRGEVKARSRPGQGEVEARSTYVRVSYRIVSYRIASYSIVELQVIF